jgi:ribosomal protein S18 acetylase RimI-like enzyme
MFEDVKFVRATLQDVQQIKAWFTNQQDLSYWGGPGLRYPITLGVFLQQTRWQELASYSLVSVEGELLAFGQFYVRLGKHHLGRLAVSPHHRNRGLGKLLVGSLITQAQNEQLASGASLFVMADNLPAVACYQSLGFRDSVYPEELPGGLQNCTYMIRD